MQVNNVKLRFFTKKLRLSPFLQEINYFVHCPYDFFSYYKGVYCTRLYFAGFSYGLRLYATNTF